MTGKKKDRERSRDQQRRWWPQQSGPASKQISNPQKRLSMCVVFNIIKSIKLSLTATAAAAVGAVSAAVARSSSMQINSRSIERLCRSIFSHILTLFDRHSVLIFLL